MSCNTLNTVQIDAAFHYYMTNNTHPFNFSTSYMFNNIFREMLALLVNSFFSYNAVS